MAMTSLIGWALIVLISYLVYHQATRRNTHGLPLPPGPKPLPLLGNIKDLPPAGTREYLHWLKHKDLYGPISSVTVMGMTLIPIHDKKMAHELLEQTSSKTSGRPAMVMASKLCGYESIVICQDYNPTFRRCRKYLHQTVGTKQTAAQFRGVQEIEVNRQLVRALNEPRKWLEHIKTTAAATVLKMAYDYTIEPHKPDALVELTDKMMTEFSLASVPMAWAVDVVPALRYLPEYFPGASFKKTARRWRKSIQATAYIPYRFVRRQMAASAYRPSYVSELVQNLKSEGTSKLNHEDEHAIIWTAATLYGAAADTTVITLTAFTVAMMKFPHVQRKAQEEIDRVIGTDRLPSFDDRDRLPYVDAVVKEATRWWPVPPMGFPHTVTEDIEFYGLNIPKGANLLPAVWWFLHDPDVHPDPESFDPDRFLAPRNEPDNTAEVFGYGRRICPGRFFADSSLYLNIAQSLAAYNIRKSVARDGKEIEVDHVKPKPGILSYPTEFDFRIEPRSEKHVQLVRQLEQQDLWDKSDAELLDSVDEFQAE